MTHLLIFDVDRTLTTNIDDTDFPAHVVEKLISLRDSDLKIAIASNQGVVGLRHWMITGGFGDPSKYPSAESVMSRLSTVAGNVSILAQKTCAIYVAFAYQAKSGEWSPTPQGSEDNPMWSQEWRKPNGGMLRQAMQDAGCSSALFVGDHATDEQAAADAGCSFMYEKEFFA